MNYIDEKGLWEFLKTKNWAISTMKTRRRTICQVNRENLSENDIYEKYINYSHITRSHLRNAIKLLEEFKVWEKE